MVACREGRRNEGQVDNGEQGKSPGGRDGGRSGAGPRLPFLGQAHNNANDKSLRMRRRLKCTMRSPAKELDAAGCTWRVLTASKCQGRVWLGWVTEWWGPSAVPEGDDVTGS